MGGLVSRGDAGGILSLVDVIREHGRALEYDLMTRTGRTLTEYLDMGAGGLLALLSFVENVPVDSALVRDMEPENDMRMWHTRLQTNVILADIWDLIAAANTRKGRKAPKYPRPEKKKRIGRGAIPLSEFDTWWKDGK